MPRLEYFLIAESVSVDQATNRLSVFNILEEFRICPLPAGVSLPQAVNQLIACSSWNIEEEERGRTFRVSLHLTPPGQPIRELANLEFLADNKRQRLLQVLVGMPLTEAGDAVFELHLDGVRIASHTITVTRLEQIPPELAQAIESARQLAESARPAGFIETPAP